MKPSNPSRVLTLERGLQILEYIVERRNVTVTNVATAFGIQKSASHRFLNTLKYMGYVEQTPQSDYALTGRLRYLAEGVVPRIEVRNFARPYLEELSKAAEQPSNLGHWDGREIVSAQRLSSALEGMPRATHPAYCSAMGKAVLAFSPREEMEAYVARTQFTRFTEKTICDRAMFLKELEAIRERGYAVMNEEMAAHLVGVAAPVFNKEGYPRYAVSVAGLCFRPVEAFVAEVCDDVVQTAREISEFLAHARTMEDK
ncbi:MAG: IclR family transcriptional regulator [Bilophila wadsworthia]